MREIPDLADGATPTAEALTEALIFSTHAIRQFVDLCMGASPHMPRLSMPRAHLLLLVAESGSVRMGDLSRLLGVTPRNVTTLADAIEREGLIVRRPDPEDRRAILLELSAAGDAMMDEVHAAQRSISERLFAPLNAAERRQFYDLLRRLSAGAQKARRGEEGQGWHPEQCAPWQREDPHNATREPRTPHEKKMARTEQAIARRKSQREDANARKKHAKTAPPSPDV